MSELLDRVRNGLECCVLRDPDDHLRCGECPYNPHAISNEPCANGLKFNALALIRQQQERIKELEAAPIPRLLTLEEAKCTHYTMPIIVEQCQSRCENLLCAGKVKGGIRLIRANGQGFALHWSSYGPTWRMWSAFPTLEQREAVPWNE